MATRIFKDNFVDDDILAARDQSSEQSVFPASNVIRGIRRSKVWRSDGFFNITSSNDTIVFRETVATDLTGTIVNAEYQSRAAFYVAVKSAMEGAAGAGSTYTIEIDSTTLKTKLTSNGSGGGGIFEPQWQTGDSDLADLLGFDSSAADTGSLTYTADTLSIHQEEFLEYDFGVPDNPTGVILTGPRNGSIKISPGATIKLLGNDTGNFTSPQESVTLTYNDSHIISTSSTGLFSTARRFARIQIIDIDNAQGFVELGAVFLGDFFSPTRGAIQFGFTDAHIDRSSIVVSEGGQVFSDDRPRSETFQTSWFGLTISEKETIQDFFEDVGISIPFFIQFESENAISSSVNFYTRYVKFASAISFAAESPGNYSASMTFREEL